MKIAFLFLIYSNIAHEDVWYQFFSGIHESLYKIFIHYKYDEPLNYFNHCKLKNCIETKWGDVSLVRAQNLLLREAATQDKDITHFVFCSGTCIPLKHFNHIYTFLSKFDSMYSHFNMRPDKDCFPRCNNALNLIDHAYIKKASQWSILSRKHAQIMLDSDVYINWFSDTIGDEHCYITYLHYLNLEHEIIKTINATETATTFTNWLGVDGYRYSYQYSYSMKHKYSDNLKNYSSISTSELLYLINAPCLFGRKFLRECKLPLLKKYLKNQSSKQRSRSRGCLINFMECKRS
jgi:hypothetical protein